MLIEVVGFLGMLLLLFAFIMNQLGKWDTEDLSYDFVNTIGSLMMVVYAFFISSYPFLILNSVWFIVSLRDVFLDIKS